ncbi:helix-turn-helix domain-containing protein [Streptomyces sp. NPDC059224]|uniref:helix-turn-helix domain-containing protein n=1 Tax=Streptomyces sp. NPDC059224 TaxID=3346775 RepID=UPI00369679ED
MQDGAWTESNWRISCAHDAQPSDRRMPRPVACGGVSGLRHEEVAELAGISVDYYTRLEQNRTSRPSAKGVAAPAAALDMSPAQRAHLFRLGPAALHSNVSAKP